MPGQPDDKFWLIIAHHHLGASAHATGVAFAESVRFFEQALSIGRTWDINNYVAWNSRGANGGATPDRVIRMTPRNGPAQTRQSFLLWCAEVCFLTGRREEALEAGEQGLTRYRHRGERGAEGWVLHLLGEIAAVAIRSRSHGRTTTTARPSPSPTELGMRPLVAHCHLGLGKLYRRTGDGRRPRST